MALGLDLGDDLSERLDQGRHAVKLVLGEGLKLLDVREHVDELDDATAEQVELSKNLSF